MRKKRRAEHSRSLLFIPSDLRCPESGVAELRARRLMPTSTADEKRCGGGDTLLYHCVEVLDEFCQSFLVPSFALPPPVALMLFHSILDSLYTVRRFRSASSCELTSAPPLSLYLGAPFLRAKYGCMPCPSNVRINTRDIFVYLRIIYGRPQSSLGGQSSVV